MVCKNISLVIPFVDNVITELEIYVLLLSLPHLPCFSVQCSASKRYMYIDIAEVVEMFKGVLLSPELTDQIETLVRETSVQAQPSSCAQVIKQCDVQQFRNIPQLLCSVDLCLDVKNAFSDQYPVGFLCDIYSALS